MQHLESKEALAEANATLLAAIDEVDQAGIVTIGDELWLVAGLLDDQPALRRLLSNGTTTDEHRLALAEHVFGAHISAATQKVLNTVVAVPWSNSVDQREGLRILSQSALLRAAEHEGRLDAVEDELFRFERTCQAHPSLAVCLDDPTGDVTGKIALLRQLLGHKCDPLTLRLLEQLVLTAFTRSFSGGVRELISLAGARADKIVAIAETASKLSQSQRQRLRSALARIYGQDVVLHVALQPKLLAGLTVTIGDEVIDGSVSGRFARLRRDLAG